MRYCAILKTPIQIILMDILKGYHMKLYTFIFAALFAGLFATMQPVNAKCKGGYCRKR